MQSNDTMKITNSSAIHTTMYHECIVIYCYFERGK